MITGLPSALHFLIKLFCTKGTFSAGISTPMSPRAIIKPSETLMISSKLSIPSCDSILGKICTCSMCFSSKSSRISKTSCGLRTKEAAMKLISLSKPKRMSSESFSVIPGKLIETPGALTPLREPSVPSFKTLHTNSLVASSFFSICMSIKPSSNNTWPPS